MDINVEPQYDVPLWNETRFHTCWNPEAGVGIYLHLGRFRADLDLWWAQVGVYLPDRQLCVDRLWGRNLSRAGADIAGLHIEIGENGWTSSFEGVGELTSIDKLALAPRGASAPSRAVRWELSATPVAPVWNAYEGNAEARIAHAGDMHIQQAFQTTGWIRVGEQEYSLDGVGWSDHSSGVRDLSPEWKHHTFLLPVAPDWTAHMISMGTDAGETPWGTFFGRDGSRERLTQLAFPSLTDPAGGPVDSKLEFEISNGERFSYNVELLHAFPMTVTEDNDNINGIDWDLPGDPLVLVEGIGRLTDGSGESFYCFHERTMRRSMLNKP
ncbi:hypothetical protein [Mycolicibacterium sp.]|uniref:hypothetical protein n=1 Tax=Mycolicibacterium sp. TaxID=2320850 RepID=UPI00355F880D